MSKLTNLLNPGSYQSLLEAGQAAVPEGVTGQQAEDIAASEMARKREYQDYMKKFNARNASQIGMQYSNAPDMTRIGMQGAYNSPDPMSLMHMMMSAEREQPWQRIQMAPMMRGGLL